MKEINFDCLIQIINELKNDKKTLYSCLLINKKWSNIVIPILWKNHSWNIYKHESKIKFYNIILSFLSLETRNNLLNNEIKLPSITLKLKPSLFNYLNYCEFPEPENIKDIIRMILGKIVIHYTYDKKYLLLEQEIYKLFVNNCKDFKNLIWKTCQPLSLFPGATNCFSKLYSLSIDPDNINSNAIYEMSKICKNLNILSIYNCSKDHHGLISLIDVQKNLEKLNIYHNDINKKGNCQELSKALARKGDTIYELHLDLINNIPYSFMISLNNLKRIDIYNHETYQDILEEINEFQQYLAISKFPKLEFFNVKGLLCFKEFSLLIKETRGNILNLLIDIKTDEVIIKNTGMLIKEISYNCPNIKILYTFIESKDFIHIKSLLLNCKKLQDIRFYSLNNLIEDYYHDNIGDELLNILSNNNDLFSLNNLLISEDWGYSIDALERFFQSFREKNLISFNIMHKRNYYITDDHKEIIRKYINEGVIRYSNYM